MAEYLKFVRQKQQADRKTQTWKVISKKGGFELGIICWYAPWRQYAYIPADKSVVLNPDCLVTIAEKASRLTAEHRQSLHESRRSDSLSGEH